MVLCWSRVIIFLSTPSGWRATGGILSQGSAIVGISIHALRVEGDYAAYLYRRRREISIHALRVEGDKMRPRTQTTRSKFLSTPSGWRATVRGSPEAPRKSNFYPRPPGGGRRGYRPLPDTVYLISIHALRVEGDIFSTGNNGSIIPFLSTPSGWRATGQTNGDVRALVFLSTPSGWRATHTAPRLLPVAGISIHALRVEGDGRGTADFVGSEYFYPRPPGGGRHSTKR